MKEFEPRASTIEMSEFNPIIFSSSSETEYFGNIFFISLFLLWCVITLVLCICIEYSDYVAAAEKLRRPAQREQRETLQMQLQDLHH